MSNQNSSEETITKSNLVSANLVIIVVFLLIVGAVYYNVSKKSKGAVTMPAGINYLSPSETATKPATLYDYAKLTESTDLVTFKGKKFAFSFQYPKGLTPLTFIDDPTNAVTFKVNDMPAQSSLMMLVETISERDKTLVGKQEDFVRGYWRHFSGLKVLVSISPVENDKGLKGFKAVYATKSGAVATNEKYFFTLEGDDDHMLYVANIFPAEGQALFEKMLNSIDYSK